MYLLRNTKLQLTQDVDCITDAFDFRPSSYVCFFVDDGLLFYKSFVSASK